MYSKTVTSPWFQVFSFNLNHRLLHLLVRFSTTATTRLVWSLELSGSDGTVESNGQGGLGMEVEDEWCEIILQDDDDR
jgi:hypothetical protein